MNNALYQAKQLGKTLKGSKYIILQDAPNSLHVSVERAGHVIYDHLENITSQELLENRITGLENELISKFQIGSHLDIKA